MSIAPSEEALAANLERIDWKAAWLTPYRALGERLVQTIWSGRDLCFALNAVAREVSSPVRFVPQAQLPKGQAYERFVFETQLVPTRTNLHDFFNALVWLHWPRLKMRLNLHQARAIEVAGGVGAHRGAVRDALTLLDENGALLMAPASLQRALMDRDWQCLFVTARSAWREAHLVLVGHALLEKLVTPRKALCAHVLLCGSSARGHRPFAPLPVLGVPGWWPPNEAVDFYADTQVFRVSRAPLLPLSTGAS